MIKIKELLLDLLFPVGCINCGGEGPWLCGDCFGRIKINDRPQPEGISAGSALAGVWVAADYRDRTVASAIKAFKYQLLPDLGEQLAELMFSYLAKNEIFIRQSFDYIAPVPLSGRRQNWRGFNQSAILGRALCRRLDMPLTENLLCRTRYTHPQVGLPAAERIRNVEGIFSVGPAYPVKDASVLLLDDVVTSGATLGECARELRLSGAREVWGAVIARG